MKAKYLIILSTFFAAMTTTHVANAKSLTGCDAKRAQLQQQINYAKQQGNVHQVRGLQRALKANHANCDDESLKNKAQDKIKDKQADIRELNVDLQKARSEGDQKKIREKQQKLRDAKRDLQIAQREARELGV